MLVDKYHWANPVSETRETNISPFTIVKSWHLMILETNEEYNVQIF